MHIVMEVILWIAVAAVVLVLMPKALAKSIRKVSDNYPHPDAVARFKASYPTTDATPDTDMFTANTTNPLCR